MKTKKVLIGEEKVMESRGQGLRENHGMREGFTKATRVGTSTMVMVGIKE